MDTIFSDAGTVSSNFSDTSRLFGVKSDTKMDGLSIGHTSPRTQL